MSNTKKTNSKRQAINHGKGVKQDKPATAPKVSHTAAFVKRAEPAKFKALELEQDELSEVFECAIEMKSSHRDIVEIGLRHIIHAPNAMRAAEIAASLCAHNADDQPPTFAKVLNDPAHPGTLATFDLVSSYTGGQTRYQGRVTRLQAWHCVGA
jgi:hypothetical protein